MLSRAAELIGNEPAFPIAYTTAQLQTGNVDRGLTKRQWLYGMAIQACASNTAYVAKWATEQVDSILEQWAKEAK